MQRAKECKQPLLFAVMATTPGEEVKKARQAQGLSMAALAAGAGVDPTTVRRIERGIGKGEPTKLGLLQSYLGIGPYAEDRTALQDVDLTAVKVSDLVAHLLDVATELNRRLPNNTPNFAGFEEVERPDLREHLGKYVPEKRLEG